LGITFSYDRITITNGTYSFEDIYQACSDGSVTKMGDSMYEITKDIFVGTNGNPAVLQDTQVTVNALGDLFQVYKGSELRLGELRPNGSTANGCTLLMPNLQLVYGFGYGYNSNSYYRDPENAGNLYAYNSTINGFGFWAWFSGEDQVVEIIDCIIDGFGRIQGETSILKNITIEKSHGRYGILSPKGTLGVYDNVSCGGTDNTSPNCQIYFNPEFAPQMRIVGGTYRGYESLIYTEINPHSTTATLEFIGSDIQGNMERLTKDSKTNVYFKYKYAPICKETDGSPIPYLDLTLTDKNGNSQTITTDSVGKAYIELTQYQYIGASTELEELNPYTISGTHNDQEFSFPLTVERDLIDVPLYICSGGGGGGECDLSQVISRLDQLETDLCACSTESEAKIIDKLNIVESGIKQVVQNVVDEVNENETYFKETGFRIII
jgi:hypothetical protein